jgi:hypothetical protein
MGKMARGFAPSHHSSNTLPGVVLAHLVGDAGLRQPHQRGKWPVLSDIADTTAREWFVTVASR